MSNQQYDEQTITSYNNLIIQWFERSKSERDIFTKFIFLYISFTAFLTRKHPRMNDRETINNLKYDEDASSLYMLLIRYNPELQATIQKLVSELRKQPIQNDTRGNYRNYWCGTDGVIQDETDWKNLVEYWYRVRNNLFHGRKAPEFQRDIVLVTYAYQTLAPLMEKFIKHGLPKEFD
jgi:hypothetical protein